jgi:NADPH:quinone reductase-like Zn-dependent oxidoreductase
LGSVQPGQTVLVTGAAGAVGSSVVLVARAMGARTIGTDIPGKAEHIRGADEIVPYSDRLSIHVKELTAGEGVDSVPLALGSVILRENAILGCMNSTKADLTEALRLIAEGMLAPFTPTVLPLEDAQHAHDLMRQRKSMGKIILRP